MVIKPTMVQDETIPLPVVYLLHGYSGRYDNWIKNNTDLTYFADILQMLIVCPDGGYGSWYIDSPIDPAYQFETYISKEVPEYIESHYTVIKNRTGRAITGLSMGGHGGLFLGFRHSDFYGACGSTSGGVDLRPFPKNWEISKRIGDPAQYPENWENYSVINIVEKTKPDSLAIIFDCGTEDFFYQVNRNLHEKMLELKIKHDYIERPGGHTGTYWRNSLQYQLLFFKNYFKNANK